MEHSSSGVITELLNEHKHFETLFKDFFATRDPFNQRLILDNLLSSAAIHLALEKTVVFPWLFPQLLEDKKHLEAAHSRADNLVCILSEWIRAHLEQETYMVPSEWPAWPMTVIVGLRTALSELKALEMRYMVDIPQRLSKAEFDCLSVRMEDARRVASTWSLPSVPSLSSTLEKFSLSKCCGDNNDGECDGGGCEHTVLLFKGLSSSSEPTFQSGPAMQ